MDYKCKRHSSLDYRKIFVAIFIVYIMNSKCDADDNFITDSPVTNKIRSQDKVTKDEERPIDREKEANSNVVKVLLEQNLKKTREMHKEVVKGVLAMKKYEHQYELSKKIINKVVDILNMQKVILKNDTSSDAYFLSLSNFKNDTFKATLDLLGNVVLFSEMVHNVTEKMRRIMKTSDPEWLTTLRWAYDYTCQIKNLIEPKLLQMINVAMQETNVIERESNYQSIGSKKIEKEKNDKTKRKKKTREPVLTRIEL